MYKLNRFCLLFSFSIALFIWGSSNAEQAGTLAANSPIKIGQILPLTGLNANILLPDVFFMQIAGSMNRAKLKDTSVKGIHVSPVPDFTTDLPAAKEFQALIKKYAVDLDPNDSGGFYAYLVMKLYAEALKVASKKNEISREGIINAFESFRDVDIGIDVKITITKDQHEALKTSWGILFQNDTITPIEWTDLKKLDWAKKNNPK